MKRTFCDCCGQEIERHNVWADSAFSVVMLPVGLGKGHVDFKITRTIGFNDELDLCRNCVLDAARKLDNRPTQAPRDIEMLNERGDTVKGAGLMILKTIRERNIDLTLELADVVREITGCD